MPSIPAALTENALVEARDVEGKRQTVIAFFGNGAAQVQAKLPETAFKIAQAFHFQKYAFHRPAPFSLVSRARPAYFR